ncbi:MAG: HAD family hydrolase [Candidatus Margulisiibacteriota bacterium]|nr:HAD family hydrolase [Candidatus Margulisiibacteriota bacterium]
MDRSPSAGLPPAIDAMQEMLDEEGFSFKTKTEISSFIGYGERPFIAGSIGSEDEDDIARGKNSYYRIYGEKLQKIKPYPHVKEILKLFKNKKKIIISNKKDIFIKMILKNLKLNSLFAEVLGEDSIENHKPDPTSINTLLKKYKINPQRALIVGDMTVDIETGKNAGTLTCGVAYGFHGREKLMKAKPDFLVDDLSELKQYIS